MANENLKAQKIYGKYIKDLPQVTEVNDTDDIIIEDSTPVTNRVKLGVLFDSIKKRIASTWRFTELNNQTIVEYASELNKKLNILDKANGNGSALKVFDATENLVYGCWQHGLYRYSGYYGNGAPSDWAGIVLVTPVYQNGEINGYLKVAWDMGMSQYIMKNNKDGSVAQAWTKM